MFAVLAVPIAIAFVVSLVGTRAAMWLSPRVRLVDRPGSEAHKQHPSAVPYGGGVAMGSAIALALICALALPEISLPATDAGPNHGPLWPVWLGALALLAVGLADDRRALPARAKLIVQAGVAALVVPATGLSIDCLAHHPLLAYGLAWAWLVLITNAFNLLDHADGLSGSCAVVSATVLLSGCLMAGDLELARLWMVLIAAIAGFLVWNLPPARVYMGDAGSLPLGFLIGVGTLSVTFWPSGRSGSFLAVLSPLLITAIPLFDTAVVVVKRLRRRRPVMRGDRNHISHRLKRLGLSPRASLATAVALQIALAASAIQLRTDDLTTAVIVLAQAAGILVAVVLLETSRDHHDP